MRRSTRQQGLYLLSMLFAVAPIAFALIRAFNTGYDLRYLWMALASFAGAAIIMAIGRARRRSVGAVIGLSALAFVAATLVAASAGELQGAKAAASVWVVSAAFGFCWAVSHALDTLSRPRREGDSAAAAG